MSFLDRVEAVCAAFIEQAFARSFPSDLEPAQIARKLVATMEAKTRGEEGAMNAPGAYVVFVNPSDFERLASHQAYLEREWAALLRDLAGRVGITFTDGPNVEMTPRASVPAGAVDIRPLAEMTASIAVQPSGAPERRFHLRMVKGVPAYGVYSIHGRSVVGRSEECDVFLVDPSVSRTHAILEIADGQATVRDLGSTNGTFVNGRQIETRVLSDGDELMFGDTTMRFEGVGS